MPNNKENVNNRVEGTSALQPDLQKGVEKSGKNVNVTDFDEYKKAQQNEANKGIKIIKDELINPIESKAKTGGNVNIGGDGSITIGGGRVIGGKEGGSGDRTKGGKKKNLGLRIAAGAMAGVVAISGGMYAGVENFRNMVNGWFGGNNVGPGEVPPPITTPGTMSSQEATPGVSLSPSATENMVSAEMQEKFAMAPEIDGLYKDIQEKDGIEKVVYLYESDNPYGGPEDEYAGEFKKEIFVLLPDGSTKEIGGIVMIPDVIEELIKYTNETICNAIMPIPVDISRLRGEDVTLSVEELKGDYPYSDEQAVEKIDIEGNPMVDLVCVSFERDSTYSLYQDENYGWVTINSYASSNEWEDKRMHRVEVSEEEWCSFLQFGGNINIDGYIDGQSGVVNYGDTIAQATSPVYLSMSYNEGIEGVSTHIFEYRTNDERSYIPVFISGNSQN
ncbi:MAG: hypothetical protein PHX34_01615 [Candidatus Shapirobacteria bacterium]|nr:hypothetical protein [Candidatus Shapirobacteria bacterium]